MKHNIRLNSHFSGWTIGINKVSLLWERLALLSILSEYMKSGTYSEALKFVCDTKLFQADKSRRTS